MSETPHTPTRRIDPPLARSLKGEASPAEEAAVRAWRHASPENELRYREFARLVALSARVPNLLELPPRPSAAKLIAKSRSEPQVIPLPRRLFVDSGRWIAAAAAAVALVLGTHLYDRATRKAISPAFGVREIVTSESETATFELLDGTVVKLAPSSRLSVLADQGTRRVVLEGRGFFAVAEQDGLPFVVRTDAGDLTVLGTRFDVEARAEQLRLLVVEGRVALSTERERTEVTGGEMGRIVGGRTAPVTEVPDMRSRLKWTGDFLAFQSTPLSEAAREIERVYGVRVEIAGELLAERVVTAWFADTRLDEVLDIICLAVAVRCVVEDGVVRITPRLAEQSAAADSISDA